MSHPEMVQLVRLAIQRRVKIYFMVCSRAGVILTYYPMAMSSPIIRRASRNSSYNHAPAKTQSRRTVTVRDLQNLSHFVLIESAKEPELDHASRSSV